MNITTKISQVINGEVSCIDDNFIMVDKWEKLNISTKYPIRLSAATISVCFCGEMVVEINGIDHQINPGKLVITLANDIIQYKKTPDDIKGLLLIVSPNFLEDALQKVNDLFSLFLYIQKYPCLNLAIREQDMIRNFYAFFESQLSYKHPYPYQNKIIRSILQAFIYYITSLFNNEKDINKHDRHEEIFRQFILLIIKHYKDRKKLDFYAQHLCISSKYLCDIIKKTSRRTPREWIDHYTILEAKILLRTTDKTTEQISYELNFPNASFFCKFFKKNVGMTTKQYRALLTK